MPAHGADSPVELEAPDSLRPLLVKHLDFLERAPGEVLDAAGRVALMRRARKEIREILATEGYFSPAIERQDLDDGRLRVVVTPGRRTTISALDLRFAGDVTGVDGDRPARLASCRPHGDCRLVSPSGKPTGMPPSSASSMPWPREYAAASISDSRAVIDPETASAQLEVEVDSGPVYRFGALQINGLSDYDAGLIERYRPPEVGEPYSQERLLRFQTALQNTSYFASVVVDIDRSTATPEAVPVRVDVIEAKPRRIGFGAGISSNTGYRVETSYRDATSWVSPGILSVVCVLSSVASLATRMSFAAVRRRLSGQRRGAGRAHQYFRPADPAPIHRRRPDHSPGQHGEPSGAQLPA
ncbi:MAG: hypothetical protein IPJ73_16450 [Zoogloea sp.]|nr:hypothetical protein [Zoogloea sp.]